MALKKSELYSSLWQSCDELRGGMDASQYKDYVLVLLFVKYVSDKYGGEKYSPIEIPEGASFADMVAFKGKPDIGDQINKKILSPLAQANRLADMPDFNDDTKLGSGKEKVERLTNLIAIFQNPSLDFSRNRADGDDILGDAYEYLMRHFATESGKSKGQFYTPAEVSRVMSQLLGVHRSIVNNQTTVYDPTCGSGSLLLKVGDMARQRSGVQVSLYGQEKDTATAALAKMNMVLHDQPGAEIAAGQSTLSNPVFKTPDGTLKLFDFVVANPPFSDKRWRTGFEPAKDPYERFKNFGVPPEKQGDYAYLLHIVRSLKSTGRGACILPHGVLFRGNAEAEIRKNLLQKGYIQAIIGLPANLFYGTGIPACIVLIDKDGARARRDLFLIDASRGFLKDGPKNRLREQDIHKIVDAFDRQLQIPRYSRLVAFDEIEKNDFNLNLPRYIDTQEPEDLQDIEGHLHGGIPAVDVEAFNAYWKVCPNLRTTLFAPLRPGYFKLAVEKSTIKAAIAGQDEFLYFRQKVEGHFETWRTTTRKQLQGLEPGFHPKDLIIGLGEGLLTHASGLQLLEAYDIYQHLMDYWLETMQDDAYLIADTGWVAPTYRILVKDKKGNEKDKGWACDLVPKELVVGRFFSAEKDKIQNLQAKLDRIGSDLATLEDDDGGDEGWFADYEKITKPEITARLRELGKSTESKEEAEVLQQWLGLVRDETETKRLLKEAEAELETKVYVQYPRLTTGDIKVLVVDDKWLATLIEAVHGELDRISQSLAKRVKDLAERYETPLPEAEQRVADLEETVKKHLKVMGFSL